MRTKSLRSGQPPNNGRLRSDRPDFLCAILIRARVRCAGSNRLGAQLLRDAVRATCSSAAGLRRAGSRGNTIGRRGLEDDPDGCATARSPLGHLPEIDLQLDLKSTRLNSSHPNISDAAVSLEKKKSN